VVEVDPPATLPANEIVVLQPYGSLFFAAAPVFEGLLPVVEATSRNSVVILRLRGRSELGSTVMGILHRYAGALTEVDSRLVIVSTNERIDGQLASSGVSDLVGPEWIYRGDERVGAALGRAESAAAAWVAANRRDDGDEPDRDGPA
jgi:SulP family sulfate permease